MLVIADSSPLIVLIKIGHIDILPSLFQSVAIPPQVATELAHENGNPLVRAFIANLPTWLTVRAPLRVEQIPSLHAGERAAISLATELHAALLLIDEISGRKAAAERHITFTGTVGLLIRAAESNLIDLKDAFGRVKTTDFWVRHELLDHELRLFELRRNGPKS